MKSYRELLNDHYEQPDLVRRIRKAATLNGRKIRCHEDTAAFDEFHIGGREATREIARLAGLQEGMKVIDIGCGIGGPARTLAAEFACRVTGIDPVREYCRTAKMLTESVGLSDRVTIRHGELTTLPFADRSFDAAWTAHVIMNIEHKPAFFRDIRPLLRPAGLLIFYEICAGSVLPPYLPLPWASRADLNFLVSADELKQILWDTGFEAVQWQDVSAAAVEWIQSVAARPAAAGKNQPRPLGPDILMGKTAGEKSRNMLKNLAEDRIRVVRGVYRAAGL